MMSEHTQHPQDTTDAGPEDSTQDIGGAATAPSDAGAIDVLQKERDDFYDRLLRKTAEFDNFRKRVERDRKDMIEWAAADVITDLLAIVDDFDRALAADAPPEAQGYKAGLELIQRQLADLLKKRGVTVVDALGADFDPHLHQAVAYEEVAGAREGEVVGVMAKGYKLGDRLLRPALVKVAKAS
jgi:molecular chaperone GrpE